MKAPNAQEFPTIPQKGKTAVAATKPKPKPSNQNKTQAKAESVTVRRSYSLTSEADEKINALALKMSQERSKMVSASEALRTIVDAYKVKS